MPHATSRYYEHDPRASSYHQHSVSASVPATHPYSHPVQYSARGVSPTAVRSRAGMASSGQLGPWSQQAILQNNHNFNEAVKAQQKSTLPSSQRSRSYSQSQDRSKSRQQHTAQYPLTYTQRPGAEGARVVYSDPAPLVSSSTGSSSRTGVAYTSGATGGASHSRSRSHGYGLEHTDRGRRRPSQSGPYGAYPQQQPPAQPPPIVPDRWPPARAPSPASHYPFANYGKETTAGTTHGSHQEERRQSNEQSQERRHWNARDHVFAPAAAVAPSQADSTVSDPFIHPALGWWPDRHHPALHWDLSTPAPPRYTKRSFDEAELEASPFTPPLTHMRLVINPKYQWVFDINASRGARYITLRSLLKDIVRLINRSPVPHAFWVRASQPRKEMVLRTYMQRTGRALPVVPPHRRPKTKGQIMEEAAVEGAPSGSTNLMVIDLLCGDVMFEGMEFLKGPDEWLLRTSRG